MNAAQAARHADLERLAQFGDFIGRWNERRERERAALQGRDDGRGGAIGGASDASSSRTLSASRRKARGSK